MNEGKLRNEIKAANIRLEIKEAHMELPVMKSLKGKITQEIRMKVGRRLNRST